MTSMQKWKLKKSITQMEILHLKNTKPELKNSVESFRSRLDQAEEIISELDDRSFKLFSQ